MSITPDRFSEFFTALHSSSDESQIVRPFPWQEELAARVTGLVSAEGGRSWPECLALPTGSGKTTCLDIAIFALACQAEWTPDQRTAPRRIVFVVDRRVIVDEAFEHALAIAHKLYSATDGILKEVADALRQIAGYAELAMFNRSFADAPPLTCHQLRGGMYRDDAWARTPTQPCVIASTVDQFGSRLLFRSYGRSFKSWPLHAGLAGNDCLVFLDEAHCARPFFQTMQHVQRYRSAQWAVQPVASPFQFVVMSATPPSDCRDVLQDSQADREHVVLGRRLNAAKPARLHIAAKAKGKAALRELAVELVAQAASLADGQPRAVVIFANRVATARFVEQLLTDVLRTGDARPQFFGEATVKQLRKKLPAEFDHLLMIGRMRPVDKDRLVKGIEQLAAGKAHDRILEKHIFVAATQCLEVGANLDFDALVSECASLDALRQRFGRLNRTGRNIDARAVVVIRADQATGKEADPVYGDALAATWQFLQTRAAEDDDGLPFIDFGIAAMNRMWSEAGVDEKASVVLTGPDAPVMLPSHVDSWVQTSPEPEPTPDVSVFLHGPIEQLPDFQVCWRSDLPTRVIGPSPDFVNKAWAESFLPAISLCPPSSLECMAVPYRTFVRWWSDAADTQVIDTTSDVDAPDSDEIPVAYSNGKTAVIWRGPEHSQMMVSTRDLRPGDTIVLPAALGGGNHFGYLPTDADPDVGDVCCLDARHQAVLRLHPRLLSRFPSEAQEAFSKMLKGADEPNRIDVLDLLKQIVDEQKTSEDLTRIIRALLRTRPRVTAFRTWDFDGDRQYETWEIVIRGMRRIGADELALLLRDGEAVDRFAVTQSENSTLEDSSASEAGRVTLSDHSNGVADHVEALGVVCGVGDTIVRSFKLAARFHDLGKADRRYQSFLFGGNSLAAATAVEAYAKSLALREAGIAHNSAWQQSGLPDRFRHELLSLGLALARGDVQTASQEVDVDLVLHLIAAHHGYCRPFPPIVVDDWRRLELVDGNLTGNIRLDTLGDFVPHRLDSGIEERFWRLVRRYGWWGLAWLEAIFMLADHRRSEYESTGTYKSERHELAETVA